MAWPRGAVSVKRLLDLPAWTCLLGHACLDMRLLPDGRRLVYGWA